MTEINNLPQVRTKPAFGYTQTDAKTTTFTGGKPFVNDRFEFPVDKEGTPLRFFFQADLSEVDEKVQEHLHLPKSGFLQFYHADDDLLGMDFNNPDLSESISRILYLEEAYDDESLKLPDYGDFAEDGTPLENGGLERVYYFGEYTDLLPFPNSNDNPAISEDDEYGEDYNSYYEFANETVYELYLGGYPHFT